MEAIFLSIGNILLTYYFALVLLAAGLSKVLRPGAHPLGGRIVARLSGYAEIGIGLALTQLWLAHDVVIGLLFGALIMFLPVRVINHRRNQGCECFGQLSLRVRQVSSILTGLAWIGLAAVLLVAARSEALQDVALTYIISILCGVVYITISALVLLRNRHILHLRQSVSA